MMADNVLSTFAQAGAIFNDVAQQLERGLWWSVADAQGQDLGRPVAAAADLHRVMDEANRGRQAA
jgi:hypothetical protein